MEALARCSRVLYDVELLEVMKKLRYLENKDKTPQVKFEHKDAWIHSRTNFKTAVNAFILEHVNVYNTAAVLRRWPPLQMVITFYNQQLNILTKHLYPPWCRRKSEELHRILKLGIAGLHHVTGFGGVGTYPFLNWTSKTWATYIQGMIVNYETAFECHKYGHVHGWLEQIPYYDCRVCGIRVDTVYLYNGMYRYLFTQRCRDCILRTLNGTKSIQALWRGYRVRRWPPGYCLPLL
ncbi:MAG: hypothetical protein V3W20_09975 [Candidatus Neomarinimicrobiota bacterium]